MNTKQIALDALKRAAREGGGHTRCEQSYLSPSTRYEIDTAIAALEADIAQPVEQIGWIKEHQMESGPSYSFTESKTHADEWKRIGKPLTPVYVQPQAATINSELLAIVVDICGPGSAYACNCGEAGCRTTIARAAIAKATGAQS